MCVCVCFLMLMLKFTKCTTWRCHFTSCHLAVALPVSAFPPLLLPLSPSLSLRLVSSLRLFFIFILAFVFIDSQVVWLFHFSFGRKTFDLPPPFRHSHSHTRTRTHPALILSPFRLPLPFVFSFAVCHWVSVANSFVFLCTLRIRNDN